ncbi:MAG: GNAT family N-acetyltransferase [Williamsia herbipolensis]|nr:GNAT family N-acetyltransferase [Williamsia herbipolensis]
MPEASSTVREAVPDEFADLVEIDRRAEVVFTVAGLHLPEIELPIEALARARAVFVVGDPVAGFAMIDEVDGLAHLSEIAVLPGSMRRGLGGALLDRVLAWSGEQGYPAITLTTFRDVAWNGRFYRRRGFVELDALTPGLAAIRANEADLGLDAVDPRIAMRLEL